jgi:membrane-associated HD superfamily phosphohydrolase
MPVSILHRAPVTSHRLAPVEPRYAPLFCFVLLTAACALASFAFACATPFAAFAVVAAATLPLLPALLVTLAAWLVNQAIGFGFLHYPIDATTIVWGLVIGGAALAATAAAMAVLRLMERTGTVVALAAALFGAYAAYELVLFAATPFLGGAEDFTAAIVGRIGLLSVVWTIGLVAACEVARLLNHARQHQTVS